ncbi:MAG: DUF1801 domain-containing protein [Bacteroidia bacterium]|nr:DUF1801 domain-containing protein [Bacteroidia bacterium]
MDKQKPNSIDEYLSKLKTDKIEKITLIRNIVKNTIPEASETISYEMPAFKYKNRILIYFAAFKNHISIFPAPRTAQEFADELKNYKGGKGTVQFQDSNPLPLHLIERIVKFHAAKIVAKQKK